LLFGSSWWAGGVSTDGSTSAGAGATGASISAAGAIGNVGEVVAAW
jgi:hypothetical protein